MDFKKFLSEGTDAEEVLGDSFNVKLVLENVEEDYSLEFNAAELMDIVKVVKKPQKADLMDAEGTALDPDDTISAIKKATKVKWKIS